MTSLRISRNIIAPPFSTSKATLALRFFCFFKIRPAYFYGGIQHATYFWYQWCTQHVDTVLGQNHHHYSRSIFETHPGNPGAHKMESQRSWHWKGAMQLLLRWIALTWRSRLCNLRTCFNNRLNWTPAAVGRVKWSVGLPIRFVGMDTDLARKGNPTALPRQALGKWYLIPVTVNDWSLKCLFITVHEVMKCILHLSLL